VIYLKLHNFSTRFKVEKVASKSVKATTSEADTTRKAYEFFKNLEGLTTELITKHFPSTAVTPIMGMPSIECFMDAVQAATMIKAVLTRVQTITSFFSSSGSASIGEDIVKKSVGYNFLKDQKEKEDL